MKLFKIELVFLLCFAVNFQSANSQDTISLNLNSALQYALKNNTNIVIAKNKVYRSEFGLKEAKGEKFPKLFFNANYNRNISLPVIFFSENNVPIKLGSENDFSTSLTMNMPLFSKHNFYTENLAHNTAKLQNEIYSGTKQSIINATKKAYFNYLVIQEISKVQKSRLKNAEEIENDIQKRVQKGTLTDFDLLTAKVQVATAKNNLLEAQNNSVLSSNQLKLLLGLDREIRLKLTEQIEITKDELSINELKGELFENNSIIKQLNIDMKISEDQLKLTQAAYFPTLHILGSYNYQAQASDFNFSNYNWFKTSLIGLQLQYSIFNGNVTKNKIQQAEILKKNAEEEKNYKQSEFQLNLYELFSKLNFSKQKVEVQNENMNLTSEALSLAKKRYKLGVGTFLEVNDAELSHTQARLNWLQAILSYKLAYYDYQLIIGKE